MSELFMMTTITSRNMVTKFLSFYKESQMAVSLVTLGGGTANSEMLDYFGLESSEKAVIFGIVTDEVWDYIKKGLQSKLQIDVPGTGIAFTIPLSSIGGKRELLFLTEGQKYEKGEESTLKETKHELLVVIANQGYSDLIMKAARSANANGLLPREIIYLAFMSLLFMAILKKLKKFMIYLKMYFIIFMKVMYI